MPVVAKKGKGHSGKFSNMVIFICTHKPFRVPSYIENHPELYKIITNCDDPFPPTKLDILRVNKMECDYNEKQYRSMNEYAMMNAIYHMKSKPKYIGVMHYSKMFQPDIIERIDMKTLLESGYYCVLGNPVRYSDVLRDTLHSTWSFYGYWHRYADFLLSEKVVKEMYPDLSEAFDEMAEADYLYNSQMCILQRDDFDDLIEFSIDIFDGLMDAFGFHDDDGALEFVKQHHDEYVKPYNPYYDEVCQSRIIGYLAERCIWNVWLREKKFEDGTSMLDHAAVIPWFMPKKEELSV